MYPRTLRPVLERHLAQFPAVVLLGPRQVGKTTLALEVAKQRKSIYLDLESPNDRAKLAEPEQYLRRHADKLVILDEVHRAPEIFQSLRGLIDEGRRNGQGTNRYLLLGSASIDLMRQSGESLAGRVSYLELGGLSLREVPSSERDKLWSRGGFPISFLAQDAPQSLLWRENFVRTYLERDIPQLGLRLPPETLRRLWTMLAHSQGGLLNVATLARSLAIDGKTAARYVDLLVDLLLIRRLKPIFSNTKKRLVKSPKIYLRDSGLVHALLALKDFESVLGHPILGASWEGFVIENILNATSAEACFYRTSAGAEIDLVLQFSDRESWAIEIKSGLVPKLGRGFHEATSVLKPTRSFVVYAGEERYPIKNNVEAISLLELCDLLASKN